jgi:hypothetical protein
MLVILATEEAEIMSITVESSQGKSSQEPISTEKPGGGVQACHPSYSEKH